MNMSNPFEDMPVIHRTMDYLLEHRDTRSGESELGWG